MTKHACCMSKPRVAAKHILVVEDEPMIALSTRVFLSLDGHEVDIAPDGEQGLEQFQKSRFDLVITDFKMPGMTGDKLAVKIKQMVPNQPILLVSSYVEDLGDKPPGVDAMLSKPFSLDSLRKAVAGLLEHQPEPPVIDDLSARRTGLSSPIEAHRLR